MKSHGEGNIVKVGIFTHKIWKFLQISFFASSLILMPQAFAANPTISTSATISQGTHNPSLIVKGTNFASDNDKFHFQVDLGSSGLQYDSLAFVDSSHVRFNFAGNADPGSISIQASTNAFDPISIDVSNTLIIDIASALINQVITFSAPISMKVKEKDQSLSASASSGLIVTFFSNTPSICNVEQKKIHAVNAGNCSISASQSGNSTFAPAADIIQNFNISAVERETSISIPSSAMAATNLGALQYFPEAPTGSYSDVLVAPNDELSGHPTRIQIIVPSRATDRPAVFLISAYSTDIETNLGYFVTRISLVDKLGTAINYVAGAYEIKMPAGAFYAELYWSTDGLIWQKIPESKIEFLPLDSHAIFFHEKDGSSAILTNQLGLFGFRKVQNPLILSSSNATLNVDSELALNVNGGSGSGEVNYATTTASICSVNVDGLVLGLKQGKCLLTARKYASDTYIDVLSNKISIEVFAKSSVSRSMSLPATTGFLTHALTTSMIDGTIYIEVNLCSIYANEKAALYVGTKTKTGSWGWKKISMAQLNGNGIGTFELSTKIKTGQKIRVLVNDVIQMEGDA